MDRSMANGSGNSTYNGDIRPGDPVPLWLRTLAYLDARVTSTTFWDLL